MDLVKSYAFSINPKKKKVAEQYKESIQNNKSEIQYFISGLFYIYKDFFSSQDFNHCVFHPSCSVYCVESIKTKGIVKGGIKTFDRLTRCNGFSNEKYEKDYERKRLLDPVEK
jgi:putative membrane protein insertion efficiency factor